MSEIEERLAELERLGLHRRLRLVSGPQGPRVLLDGKPVLLLCSNNYLGLADHPRVREAAGEEPSAGRPRFGRRAISSSTS
jgi:7-keto-8-aminopelargonate synthetase-like enzyme